MVSTQSSISAVGFGRCRRRPCLRFRSRLDRKVFALRLMASHEHTMLEIAGIVRVNERTVYKWKRVARLVLETL